MLPSTRFIDWTILYSLQNVMFPSENQAYPIRDPCNMASKVVTTSTKITAFMYKINVYHQSNCDVVLDCSCDVLSETSIF
jgi:hypothetical protein